MIRKRDIIKLLIENEGFQKCDSWMDCLMSPNRNYFVEVTSRSKLGWTHIFCNNVTHERIEFNGYWIYYFHDGSETYCKLNKNNEDFINCIIKSFLRK